MCHGLILLLEYTSKTSTLHQKVEEGCKVNTYSKSTFQRKKNDVSLFYIDKTCNFQAKALKIEKLSFFDYSYRFLNLKINRLPSR